MSNKKSSSPKTIAGPCKGAAHPFDDPRVSHAGVSDPFVTVVVTSYNYEGYIEQCLKSVAAQTYQNFKCIVVDDCSSDKSAQVIQEFVDSKESKGKFTFIRREQNGGQMAAFKTGLAHAEGAFVTLVDADDALLEDFLATHLRTHLGRFTVAFTSSNQYQMDARGEIIGGNHHDLQSQGDFRHVYHTTFFKPYWLWATTSSMMFRRSVLELILPENEDDFRICADNYIVHFANLVGGSLLIPSIHGCYRRHGKNFFGSNPVVGGHLPVGDMATHPEHETVRSTVLHHLLRNYDKFRPIFGVSGCLFLVQRIAFFSELGALKQQYPEAFPKSAGFYQRDYLRYHGKRRWWRFRTAVKNLFSGKG